MKLLPALGLAGLCPLAMILPLVTGCASQGGSRLTADKGLIAAESAFDVAVNAGTAVLNTCIAGPTCPLTAAQIIAIRDAVDRGNTVRIAADAVAQSGGDVTSQTAALTQLAAAIQAIIQGH